MPPYFYTHIFFNEILTKKKKRREQRGSYWKNKKKSERTNRQKTGGRKGQVNEIVIWRVKKEGNEKRKGERAKESKKSYQIYEIEIP